MIQKQREQIQQVLLTHAHRNNTVALNNSRRTPPTVRRAPALLTLNLERKRRQWSGEEESRTKDLQRIMTGGKAVIYCAALFGYTLQHGRLSPLSLPLHTPLCLAR